MFTTGIHDFQVVCVLHTPHQWYGNTTWTFTLLSMSTIEKRLCYSIKESEAITLCRKYLPLPSIKTSSTYSDELYPYLQILHCWARGDTAFQRTVSSCQPRTSIMRDYFVSFCLEDCQRRPKTWESHQRRRTQHIHRLDFDLCEARMTKRDTKCSNRTKQTPERDYD